MKYILVSFLVVQCTFCLLSQSIFIDGNFSDWQSVAPLHTDNSGDQGLSDIDFGELWIHNDNEFLFLSFELGKEINLQDNNEIEIWIDTDNNPATGVAVNGIGADLFYSFGNRSGIVYLSGTQTVFHNDIGLFTAPTVSSNRFELAIRRDIAFTGQALFQGDLIKVYIEDSFFDGDMLPDVQGGIEYTFLNSVPVASAPYAIEKTNAAHLRILSYNVLFNGLFEFPRSVSISRLLQAIQPEIISFQEIYDFSSVQVRDQVEAILPSSGGESWYHAKAGPDVHTISRFPILNTFTIDGNGAFLLDLNEKYGTELLLVGTHFPCCANDNDRQLEVDAIMAFIRDAKAGTGALQLTEHTPIVILGDMNLVGDAQQVKSLLEGDIFNEFIYGNDFSPDWDGTAFEDAHPFTTDMPMSFTWYNEGSSFGPGRLDYIIYSGSVMGLVNSYALFSRSLPQDSLDQYNLQSEDAVTGSDHLPVVADFRLPVMTSIEAPDSNPGDAMQLTVSPNPVSTSATIGFQLSKSEKTSLSVCNPEGKVVLELFSENRPAGDHQLTFDFSALTAGLYVLKLSSGIESTFQKLVITR